MPRRQHKSGFTMIELLVVMGIVSILIGLVVVIAGKAMNQSRNAQDLANLKLLGNATWSFAADHKGRLLSSRDDIIGNFQCGDTTQEQIDRFWIRTHGTDANGHPRMIEDYGENDQDVELLSSLEDGEAYPYIGDVRAYSSPFDPTIGNFEEYTYEYFEAGALQDDRIRSYAFNAQVGCEWGQDDVWWFHGGGYNWPVAPNCDVGCLTGNPDEIYPHDCGYFLPAETVSQIPQPGGTMCAIGEWDKTGRNLGGFTIHPTDPETWIDFPAVWNNGLINMSFVDGSTGAIQIESKGLIREWELHDTGHNFPYTGDPECKDYFKLRQVILPGRIGSILDDGIEDIQIPD